MKTLAELNATYEGNRAAREFVEMGRILALARGKDSDSRLFAKQSGASARVIAAIEQKAAAGSTNTGSSDWGADLVALSQGFVSSLSLNGVFDGALPEMQRMPIQTRISLVIGRATGGAIQQGALKLVSQLELAAPTLAERKVATVLVASDELLRLTGSEGVALLQRELRDATASASDALFIATLIAALTPIPSTGDILADLQALAEAVTIGSTSQLFVVVSSLNGKRIALARTTSGAAKFPLMGPLGGIISGIHVFVSDEISDTEILMFDGSSIAANGGNVIVKGSSEAVITMEDTSGGDVVSLWQQNQRALMVERIFGFELLRTTGAAVLSDVDYSNPVAP